MKKILIFSLAYYPRHVSGAEAAVKEITDRISPADIEFHLLTHRFGPEDVTEELIGNVHVHRLSFGKGYLSKVLFIPMVVWQTIRLQKVHHIDAIWALMTYMLFPVAILRMFGVRIPYVLTLQDGDPYEKVFERPFIRPVAWLLDRGFQQARIIHAISSYLATWPPLRGYKGAVVVIPNGANPKDIKESFDPTAVEEIKQRFGKKDEDIWLVNTARLVHQKANDDTIRALAILPEAVKLLLVGGGEDEEMLRILTEELGLSARVFFVGQVDRTQVTNFRKAGDIFVCPSRSEGLGNAFLSAMASRLPVIATQEGGLADFLFDEKRNPDVPTTGWVVDKDSPAQIAAAVLDILNNPDKVKQVGETARAMVLEKYDWDNIAKTMDREVFRVVYS